MSCLPSEPDCVGDSAIKQSDTVYCNRANYLAVKATLSRSYVAARCSSGFHPAVHTALGLVWMKRNAPAAAVPHFEKALERQPALRQNPAFPDARYQRARA